MEPMTLGSPTTSPTSTNWAGPPISGLSLSSPPHHGFSSPAQQYLTPQQQPQQHPHQSLNQSGFLPNFLMGDSSLSSPASGSLSHHRPMISPTKLNRTLSSPAPSTPLQPKGPLLLKENLNRSTRGTPGDKPSGPPTTSLLLSNITPNTTQNKSSLNFSHLTPSRPTINNSTVFPPTSPDTDIDTCSTPLSTWVTVWGFPPSAASFIVQQMSGCGTVLQHVMTPNSNWMHVRFQTRLQASKAVAKNGSVIGGTIMVGVSPCRDESVLDQLNSSCLDTSSATAGGANASVASLGSGLNNTPRTIRPLTQAYKDAQNDSKVVPGTNTPNKSTGMVSKAMEYMFGW